MIVCRAVICPSFSAVRREEIGPARDENHNPDMRIGLKDVQGVLIEIDAASGAVGIAVFEECRASQWWALGMAELIKAEMMRVGDGVQSRSKRICVTVPPDGHGIGRI